MLLEDSQCPNDSQPLRAEETRIRGDLDELCRQVKSSETQLKQTQRALSVLDEKPRSKTPNHKPAATKQEVVAAMSDVPSAKGSVDEAELKRLVADTLSAVGKSRIGLALRFTEALKEEQLFVGRMAVSLRMSFRHPNSSRPFPRFDTEEKEML